MKLAHLLVLFAAPLVVSLTARAQAEPEGYAKGSASGYTLFVHESVQAQGKAGRDALVVVRQKLADAAQRLPKNATAVLKDVPVYVDWNNKSGDCIAYHPAVEATTPGANKARLQTIEIGDLACFSERATGNEPELLVRELALAWLDRSAGWEPASLRAAWERAKSGGLYASVPYVTGGMRPAHAIASPQFFFAETTESLFGRNDFFPFHREDLARFDPAGCDVVAKLWGTEGLCEKPLEKPKKKAPPTKRMRPLRPRY